MTALLLAISLGVIGLAIWRRHDLLSPFRIYVVVYSFMFAVYFLDLSRYQTPWSSTTVMLFGGASAMFCGFALLMGVVDGIRNPVLSRRVEGTIKSLSDDAQRVDWNWYFCVWGLAAATFLLSYSYGWATTGIIPILEPDADKARLDFLWSGIIPFIGAQFGPLTLILATEYLLFSKASRRRMYVVVALSALVFGVYLTLVTRFDLFRCGIFAIAIYHYGKRSLGIRHIAAALCAGCVLFMIAFLIRIDASELQVLVGGSRIHMPKGWAWAANPYLYATGSFWNLDYAVKKFVEGVHGYPLSCGYELFNPFLFATNMQSVIMSSYGFDSAGNESVTKIMFSNTISYVWYLYKDFGTAGVLAIPALFGVLAGTFYVNTLRRPTLLRMSVWALIIPCIALSYHTPLHQHWFLHMNILFVVLAHRRLKLL